MIGWVKLLTGPISVRVVSSSTFSIGDFEGFLGGGLIRVPEGITVGHFVEGCHRFTEKRRILC